MLKKTIASGALSTSAPGNYSLNKAPHAQRGVTLIELMVGIAIGLLVVAVAMGALMVSRGVTGTVSDASGIQQQGAYAMRLFGQQLRQAGSLRLNRNPGTVVAAELYLAPVAFETKATSATPLYSFDATKPEQIISGTAAPVTLVVGYRRYTEPTFISATDVSPSRNCLGGPMRWPSPPSGFCRRLASGRRWNLKPSRC